MKNIRLSIIFALLCAVLISQARFNAHCNDIRENVFRLHILANSNSKEDQELKLKVRDAVLNISKEDFENCKTGAEALNFANHNIDAFKEAAQKVINENGFDYGVEINVGTAFFENREYETFTLPAGNYNALNIKIGDANGKNWWCVMFPCVCVGASAELSDAVNKESAKYAEQAEDYKIRFKTVEIYENIKNFFKK